MFGSIPDRVVDLAVEAGVPVLVYASASGMPERIEDYLFSVHRHLRSRLGGRGTPTTRPED